MVEVLIWANVCFHAQQTLVYAAHGKPATLLTISANKTHAKLGKIVNLWSARTNNVLSVSMDGFQTLSPNVPNPQTTSFNIIATHRIRLRLQMAHLLLQKIMLPTLLPHFGEKTSFLKEQSSDHAIRSNQWMDHYSL